MGEFREKIFFSAMPISIAGGWWCFWSRLFLSGEEDIWGCFKPDRPAPTLIVRTIKYEHPPPGKARGYFALKSFPSISGSRLPKVAGVGFWPPMISTLRVPILVFWQWAIAHPEVSAVYYRRSKKKAGAFTFPLAMRRSPYQAINNGYRTPKKWKRSENW